MTVPSPVCITYHGSNGASHRARHSPRVQTNGHGGPCDRKRTSTIERSNKREKPRHRTHASTERSGRQARRPGMVPKCVPTCAKFLSAMESGDALFIPTMIIAANVYAIMIGPYMSPGMVCDGSRRGLQSTRRHAQSSDIAKARTDIGLGSHTRLASTAGCDRRTRP